MSVSSTNNSAQNQHDVTPVKRALISVFNKTGVVEFAKKLHECGVAIASTGSTAKHIEQAGIPVIPVDVITGFPEMMDGRVKTLHPHVHGAILADRSVESHLAALKEHGIKAIDLVVVNLYPFAQTIANPDTTPAQAIEMIDIGGPTMIRAAAKNHAHVGVVVDVNDYETVANQIATQGGLDTATKRTLATKAFTHTATYDNQVSAWFKKQEASNTQVEEVFPEELTLRYQRNEVLRYGENPHQEAALYLPSTSTTTPRWGLGAITVHGGKALSYNNMVDTDAAMQMCMDYQSPCVAIIKHTNPAGLATDQELAAAYTKALAGDPVSAFGGVVAVNRELDVATATQIMDVFTEVVIAPSIHPDALALLQTKKNLRILTTTSVERPANDMVISSIAGGLLLQGADTKTADVASWNVVTKTQPTKEQISELAFAWNACKHVKSNAIVLAKDHALVGVGAGQMSRVDSVAIAITKSGTRHTGSVLASDAFFPFPDGVELAIQAGISAMVSPGGSVRDQEVIDVCDQHDIPMMFTGRRHFRH